MTRAELVQNPIVRFTAGLLLGLLVGGAVAAILLTVTGISTANTRPRIIQPPTRHAVPYPFPRQRGFPGN